MEMYIFVLIKCILIGKRARGQEHQAKDYDVVEKRAGTTEHTPTMKKSILDKWKYEMAP